MKVKAKISIGLLVLFAFCLPVRAERKDESETTMYYDMEVTFLHGPIPISLASPTEDDLSMEQARQIAQKTAVGQGAGSAEDLEQCLQNIHYVTLSNLSDDYRVGGWVVTYFLRDSYADVQIVMLDGASGDVLLTVRGSRSGTGWLSADFKHAIAFGQRNFFWPLEWRAVYDIVFGLPGDTRYIHVLPTENDLPQAVALEKAKTAMVDEFLATEQELEQCLVDYTFIKGWQYNERERTDDTVWNVAFYSTEQDEWGDLHHIASVMISSADGEVVGIAVP